MFYGISSDFITGVCSGVAARENGLLEASGGGGRVAWNLPPKSEITIGRWNKNGKTCPCFLLSRKDRIEIASLEKGWSKQKSDHHRRGER